MNNIAEYKTYLQDYLIRYHNINNPKSFFHCLNPNHPDHNPSMMFTDKYNICKCFSCNVHYDIFDLVGMDYNLNNFKDQIRKVEEIYLDYTPEVEEYEPVSNNHNYTGYFIYCIKNINKSDYLERRGITKELIKKYKIGFDENRNSIVFPINKYCYFARSTVNDDKFKNRGNSDIWNEPLLKNSNDVIYVTESIIDSLSLEVIDPSVKTVSINGLGNINTFIHAIKENNFNGAIVIAFDNDNKGEIGSRQLKKKLTEIGVSSFSVTLTGHECKDINELLQTDRGKLEEIYNYVNENVTRAYDAIKQEEEGELVLG